MKRLVPVILALIAGAGGAAAQCSPDQVLVSGGFGQAVFSVSLAETPETRARGLMFVEQMPAMAGMLFVYEAPHAASFWMRNTLIPLDMLFIGPDGRILTLHENAVPLDMTAIPGGDGVLAVLEINGGMAGRLGIVPGDLVQHPAFGPDAALPCPAD